MSIMSIVNSMLQLPYLHVFMNLKSMSVYWRVLWCFVDFFIDGTMMCTMYILFELGLKLPIYVDFNTRNRVCPRYFSISGVRTNNWVVKPTSLWFNMDRASAVKWMQTLSNTASIVHGASLLWVLAVALYEFDL